MRRRTHSTAPKHRLGFTLIELLIVIVILGILVGLLVPAVMRAVGTAQDAAVATEIRAMGQALADFNTKYGAYPPSRIVISESGDYNGVPLPLRQRSLTFLRRFWPRMQFNTSGTTGFAPGLANLPGKYYDANGNGQYDATPYTLTGPECLVLFLGGVPQASSAGWSMTGFSKNPVNPFQSSSVTTNRTVPLFEFNNSRLVNNPSNGETAAGGGFPGYLDSLGSTGDPNVLPFYCYFSAYGGVGYDPDDVNFVGKYSELDSDGATAIAGAFQTSNAATPATAGQTVIGSLAPNPYTTDPPIPTDGNGAAVTSPKSPAWQNAQTYQIISAGRDRLFGIGGQYLANGNERLPFVLAAPGSYVANSLQTQQANNSVTGITVSADARSREKDNITNFSPGKLD